ncbi:Histidine ammonia-lyase [Gossypium australe]|uniref:Histidine ammonia-lyase n=1 Tax=Gossypium australe TaxID=47621 RepID=A0A5B6X252_9ROSI|nr:Histidine ammonia-lyase [Gossypium australe]
MDPERAVADDVESNAPAPAQGTSPSNSRPATSGQEGEAKQAFFQMMSEWFTQFVKNNPTVSQPPPPVNPPQTSGIPPTTNQNPWNKPPIDKIRKYGVEEFRATNDDDVEKAEFWIGNTIRVFDEMSLTPEECINERFVDQKRKEFLELKQGRITVSEYVREFVRLSQYA